VTAEDANPVPLRLRPVDASEPGGFGWHLVQELALTVHVDALPAGKTVGKAVSAVLPVPRGR
jgi:hypothetical protein